VIQPQFSLGSIVHKLNRSGWTGVIIAIVPPDNARIAWIPDNKLETIAFSDLRPVNRTLEPSIREHFRKAGVWPAVEAVASGKQKKDEGGGLWK
jgi:hypothetical protein